jgi:hypothetical protein
MIVQATLPGMAASDHTVVHFEPGRHFSFSLLAADLCSSI